MRQNNISQNRILYANDLNNIIDGLADGSGFLSGAIGLDNSYNNNITVAYRSTNLVTATASYVDIGLDKALIDNYGQHNYTTNNQGITVVESGVYLIYGHIQWDTSAAGDRAIRIKINGAADSYYNHGFNQVRNNNITANNDIYMLIELEAGDYIQLSGRQTSGGNLNVLGSTLSAAAHNNTTFLAVLKLGY